jgi:hypothetical protein
VIAYLGRDGGLAQRFSRRRVPHSPHLAMVECIALAHIQIDVALDIEFKRALVRRSAMGQAAQRAPLDPLPGHFSSGESWRTT